MKIYFAGGWFTPAQEEEHTRIGKFLETYKDFEIFNPRFASNLNIGKETDYTNQVLLKNCNAIDNADLIVAITDYKDMGTLWECGYAYAKKKPIIYYCETLGNKPFNLMLAKTGNVAKNVIDLDKLLKTDKINIFKQIYSFNGLIE